jgi:hypothetical protein
MAKKIKSIKVLHFDESQKDGERIIEAIEDYGYGVGANELCKVLKAC